MEYLTAGEERGWVAEALGPDSATGFVAMHKSAYQDTILSLCSSEESNFNNNPN